ncbi:putative progesterone-induced-blocking factor 1 [Plasmopara halstedii]
MFQQKFVKELDHLAKELKQTQANLEAAQTQLRMEKMHFATLQISDALAEQLSRQDEEDLSVREYIQLSIHSKVRKLEIELERCRQELELLKGTSDSDKFAAASALSKMNHVQRNAELSERRLQSELELLVATRNELENQIKTLLNQIDALKEKERQNEEMYSDQRGLVEESQRLKSDMEALQHENNELKLRFDKVSAEDSELRELVSMLTADKTFLLNAKTHLEDQMAKMKLSHDEMREKMKLLREKHDGHLDHSVQLQNETRLHFETKLNSEMTKFMELSKREIERIRNDGQLVYERENRLLKETRDDALKHVEMLQARLDSVQSALDEKVFESTRLESMHSTALATARNELKFQHFEMSQLKLTLEEKAMAVRNARLEIEMLTRKIETHKDEFTKLETTSTTRITQLEANLNVERNKLKEYELLEINLDDAILQTGEIAASKDSNEKTDDGSFLKLKEVVNTFGAIPTMKKRRFQQSVLLAQRLVKSQREAIALTQKLNEVISDRSRLQQEIIELKAQLASFHQPQSYLIEKLTRREQELQGAKRKHQEVQSQLQQLRVHYDQIREANLSLQHQLQQLLSRREDLDALKATVQLLRSKIDDSNEHKQLTYQLKLPLPRNSRSCATATDHCDAVSSSPVTSTVSKVFPSPSIFSKMTKSPTQVYKNEGVISFPVAPSSSNISCAPKWYTKLRCTSGDGQDINKSI